MSDEDLPPTHRPWGDGSDPANDASHQPPTPPPPPPPPPTSQQGAPFAPPPNPYPQPGSFDQYAAPNPYGASPYGGYPGGPGYRSTRRRTPAWSSASSGWSGCCSAAG
ncbi:hypothetical protein [Nocardioides cynanchi]|uniref:hypothetical protein n=1 Tax=Nocardioides cynanchi TaxID=2558918 RepID=UPI001784E5DD|nr:hypothetical protein [Nocardioides cynanchi]